MHMVNGLNNTKGYILESQSFFHTVFQCLPQKQLLCLEWNVFIKLLYTTSKHPKYPNNSEDNKDY